MKSLAAATVVAGLGMAAFAAAPATRPAATRPAEAPFAPQELPGKGLAQHDFMYAGEALPLTISIIRDGKVAWSYVHPGTKGEISDATMLSNGNIVFAYQFGVAEVTPEKKIVWSRPAPAGNEIHTVQPLGLDRVAYVQNGDPAKLIIVTIADDKTEKELPLQAGNPKSVHGQFRHMRVTAAGTFLIAHMDANKVVEYDGQGKELWSYAMNNPWAAARLKNGNTLITSGRVVVREVTPEGETVWELTQKDVPEIRLSNTQTATRLANGNTILNNWHGKGKDGNDPVQLIEVTPEKKVVWALRSWNSPDLGASTNIQLLDASGKPDENEMQR